MMTFNEELLEIFSWMPAKCFYKFLSVCKSSFQLLPNDFFTTKQFKNMQRLGDTDYFIEPDYFQRYKTHKLEIHALYSSNFSKQNMSSSLPETSVEFLAKTSRILASCNGLLCCRNLSDDENPMFLFNPITQSYLSIPSPDEISIDRDFSIIFECEKNEDTVDYLLMALVSPVDWSDEFHSKIYSPEEKIWKDGGRVYLGARRMIFEFSVYLNGVIYMVSDNSNYLGEESPFYWPYVVAYEIKNATSKFLEIPKDARKELDDSRLGIFKWRDQSSSIESICLVKLLKNAFTVWVWTKKQHPSSSYYWKRVLEIQANAIGLQHSDDMKVVNFTIINGSVLLFATQDKIYRYDLMDRKGKAELECTHEYGELVRFISFSSTLRPSGFGAITLP